jgi:hypothetical protein
MLRRRNLFPASLTTGREMAGSFRDDGVDLHRGDLDAELEREVRAFCDRTRSSLSARSSGPMALIMPSRAALSECGPDVRIQNAHQEEP